MRFCLRPWQLLPPGPADLEDSLGEAGLLRELLQVLGIGIVVNGKVRLHCPKLVVLEGGAHALCLLAAGVGLVTIQVFCVVLVTTQRWERDTKAAGKFSDPAWSVSSELHTLTAH